jgi:hypothetical protein
MLLKQLFLSVHLFVLRVVFEAWSTRQDWDVSYLIKLVVYVLHSLSRSRHQGNTNLWIRHETIRTPSRKMNFSSTTFPVSLLSLSVKYASNRISQVVTSFHYQFMQRDYCE